MYPADGIDNLVKDVLRQSDHASGRIIENGTDTHNDAAADGSSKETSVESLFQDMKQMKMNMKDIIAENECLRQDNNFLKRRLDSVEYQTSLVNGARVTNGLELGVGLDIDAQIRARAFALQPSIPTLFTQDTSDESERIQHSARKPRLKSFVLARLKSMRKVTTSVLQKEETLPQDCERKHIENTETIHMYAISMLYFSIEKPTRWRKIWSWLMALASFIIVWVQVSVMLSIIIESSNPTCTKHEDCVSGQFCTGLDQAHYRQPRCGDCSYFDDWQEQCDSSMIFDNVNKQDLIEIFDSLWFQKDYTPSYDLHEGFQIPFNDEDFFMNCLGLEYCRDSIPAGLFDSSSSVCPYLDLLKGKLSSDQMIVFFFVILFFATSLAKDMQEAIVEDAILQHTIDSLKGRKYVPRSLLFIRISNRIRINMMPWITAAAGASILIYDALSAKNIVLNLLAVLFITEADNMLANLFLSPGRHSLSNELVQETKQDSNFTCPLWVPKSRAIIISSLMYSNVIFVDFFASTFAPQARCDGVNSSLLVTLCLFAPIADIVIQSIWKFARAKNSSQFLERSQDLMKKFTAFFICIFILSLNLKTINSKPRLKIPLPSVMITLVVGIIFHNTIIHYQIHKTRAAFAIFAAIAWFASFFWAFSVMIQANVKEI